MKNVIGTLLFFALLSSLSLAQNGTRMIGFDALSMGRGGTSIGGFDTPELMMTNPAGIAFLNKRLINANLSVMLPTVHFKNSINDLDGEDNVFPLPGLTYINGQNDSKLTWGAGVFTSGGMGADFTMKHALYRNQDGTYNLQEYHSQLASMQGGISLAYKINEQYAIGLSLHMVYSTLEFSMPYSLNPSIMKGTAQPGMTFGQMFAAPQSAGGFGYSEVTATAKMSELVATGFNGKLGFAYKMNDKLSFGVSYTLPTSLTFTNGKASMDMTQQFQHAFGQAMQGYMMQNPGATPAQAQAAVMGQFAQMGIDLSKGVKADYNLEVELAFPQSLGFGISYVASESVKLGVDVEWINWESAFDKMKLKLSDGNNSNINTMLGNSGAFSLDFPMQWENTILLKLGGEYQATNALTLRMGYVYGGNPVPESTVFPVFPAIVEQHISAGASYKISDPLTIHAAFEMALNNSLTATNPSLIANEYNASSSDLSTTIFHIACTYSF